MNNEAASVVNNLRVSQMIGDVFMRNFKSLIGIVLAAMFVLSGCNATVSENDVWENATYTENQVFGSGEKSVVIEVVALEKSVEFEINTDRQTVGEALIEHDLISGEKGPYGLYVKVVNGITADYDIDQTYWSFSKNGEYLTTGVDMTDIENGVHYELTYTK